SARDAKDMFDILLHQASDQQLRRGLLAVLYFRHCESPRMSSSLIAVLCRYQAGSDQTSSVRANVEILRLCIEQTSAALFRDFSFSAGDMPDLSSFLYSFSRRKLGRRIFGKVSFQKLF